ncbi:MAG: pseudouridine synthase [Minisyncoccia bacterium]
MPTFPMRINRYLAHRGIATRKDADTLIEKGQVFINSRKAVLGDKVNEKDVVDVRRSGKQPTYRYVAYHKPIGVVTHSAEDEEEDIKLATETHPELRGLFPVGRLDKNSHGLIILTNDGRVTDRLLNPDRVHDKEYAVKVRETLRDSFQKYMERGVDIGDYTTKPCKVRVTGEHAFSITLTEGKKHQVRRMAEAMHLTISDLRRVRIMNIKLGDVPPNGYRPIKDAELALFLKELGL